MRKVFLFIMIVCSAAVVHADEVNAVKVTQNGTTDWYQFDNTNRIHVSITDGNPVFPTKSYDLADGNLLTGFGTVPPEPINVSYIDEQGETQTTDAWEVKNATERVMWGTTGETTWYVVTSEDVKLNAGALCNGDVRLILADGAKLTTKGEYTNQTPGIYVTDEGNSLTIYAQSTDPDQMGKLIANGSGSAAGIGGAKGGSGSHITINGGIITANGGSYAAGIGGGHDGNGTYITINGGVITATGKDSGAGIGGGGSGYGRNITINGGTIIATGGNHYGVGIGSSKEGEDYNIYISDAYVLYVGENETLTDVDIVAHTSATDLSEDIEKRYTKIEGLATPYTRDVTKDQWGTVCLPYAATSFSGATFYKVNYFDGSDKLYIEPVTTLAAGMPYIFEATATGTLTINHEATTPLAYGEAGNEGDLFGSFARKVIASDGNMAAISGGQVVIVENGYKLTVPACRAYLDMTEVPTTEQPHSAPLRVMGARQTPTDNASLHHSNNSHARGASFKILKDGQFRIVKDGKMYNAQGIEVQ